MSIKNLDAFFNPKKIAVIGASENKSSLGYHVFRNLIGKGFKGIVYPVNPSLDGVQGVQAYKSVRDIANVDLAIITTEIEQIPTVLEECGQNNVKGVLLLTANFEYRASKSQQILAQIKQLSQIYGVRVMGPSSIGFLKPSLNLNASLFEKIPSKGNIAFISQSGTFSTAFLERAVSKNVGFSAFISLGAKVDIDFADLIDYLGIDAETRAIILYLHNIHNGRKFITAVRSFANAKPIVVVKSGKSDSTLTSLTYSGMLAGKDKVYDSAFKRAGAVRVDEMLDLFYMTETLAKQKRPKGNRLAIISNSIGPSAMAVDALLRLDGEVANLNENTINEIQKSLLIKRPIRNPIYLFADASASEYESATRACIKDPEVDGLLVIFVPFPAVNPISIAESIVSVYKNNKNAPIFTVWLGDEQVIPAREILSSSGIPTFVTPEQAVKSFIYMYSYDMNLRLMQETPEFLLKDFKPDTQKVAQIFSNAIDEQRTTLYLDEVKDVLQSYGIKMVNTVVVKSKEQALTVADDIGYPVVLKIDSPKINHKIQSPKVCLNLNTPEAVMSAFDSLQTIINEIDDSNARIIMQPMIIRHGYELIIGAKKDGSFGSVIVFGTGGELVDVIRDYSVALPPLNQTIARRLMQETKIYNYLLKQQSMSSSIRSLEETLLRFSQLIVDFAHIKEADINPFIITDKDTIALDATIVLDENVLYDPQVALNDVFAPHLCITPYPSKFIFETNLSDGQKCIIRPIRGEDEPAIYNFFKTLSEETIMFRFCQKLTDMPHEKRVRYCQIDYDRELAFVATIQPDKDTERIIGDVRLSKLPDLESAELSILISDDYQGKGVGNMLMDYCLKIAKSIGLKIIWMEILKTNRRMISLGTKYGFKQAYSDEDMVRVALHL